MGRRGWFWASLLLVVVGALLVWFSLSGTQRFVFRWFAAQTRIFSPTRTSEPLIPTRTPTRQSSAPEPPATRTIAPTPISTRASHGDGVLWQGRARWGVGVAVGPITRYDVDVLRLGWYLDWTVQRAPARPGDIEYAQMIRVKGGVLSPDASEIAEIARANPGALWLIGNEPDVKWQDNVDAATYAILYHEAYAAIKSADTTARVAIGGISQPTPLRLRYLDAVLAAYRERFSAPMPVDVWNIHNFILREERGSWGVDIPPGMSDERGILYEVDDSGNLQAFRQQIVDFRRWMVERGYAGYPLVVSEYGIPMPEDYGFPPERVAAFLRDTFDFFLTATDPVLGDPSDGYRLVQRWCWYSLSDVEYRTGNLFAPEDAQVTLLGKAWADLVARVIAER